MRQIEKEILQLFLEIDFSWKKILIEQLKHINMISREYVGFSYYLYISVDKNCNPISVEQNVPIEIIVEHDVEEKKSEIYYQRKELEFQEVNDLSPTGFLLFVKNGYLAEIQVYSLGGDKLDMDKVCDGKRYYFVLCP